MLSPEKVISAINRETPGRSQPDQTTTLERLPVEIIDVIAHYVRQDPEAALGIAQRYKHCACIRPEQRMIEKIPDVEPNDQYRDPALNLSMACRRLRHAVFDNVLERKIRGGLCHPSWQKTSRTPEHLSNAVRSLEIDTRPRHELTSTLVDFNDYLSLLPSLERLHINWSFPFINKIRDAKTQASAVTHLTLAMTAGLTDGEQPPVDLVVAQMPKILRYLRFPDLRTIVLEITMESPGFGDEEEDWEALAHAVSGLAEFDKLEEVSVRFKIYAEERGDTKLGVKLKHVVAAIVESSPVQRFYLAVEFDFLARRCDPFSQNRDGTTRLASCFTIRERSCEAMHRGMLYIRPTLELFDFSISGTIVYRESTSERYHLLSFQRGTIEAAGTAEYKLDLEAVRVLYEELRRVRERMPTTSPERGEFSDEADQGRMEISSGMA